MQRVTSPQEATSSMKYNGGVDDSDDEEWNSDHEDEPAGEARSPCKAQCLDSIRSQCRRYSSRKVCW